MSCYKRITNRRHKPKSRLKPRLVLPFDYCERSCERVHSFGSVDLVTLVALSGRVCYFHSDLLLQMRAIDSVLSRYLLYPSIIVACPCRNLHARNVYVPQAAVERESEQLYAQWREHLKSQAEEFQQLQHEMVPSR